MRKAIITALVLGLLAGSLVAPAAAKKKKKKPPAPQPVATTMYMEGVNDFGEQDQLVDETYLKLQAAEGSGQKSIGIPNYTGGPNDACAGNSLVPVFVGPLSGKVVGDLKVTFPVASSPASQVDVRVWPDVNAQACNDAYIEPAGETRITLPAGQGTAEATITGLDFEAASLVMIQITPVILTPPPSYGRVLYGTADSKIEFSCLPPAGATTCVTE